MNISEIKTNKEKELKMVQNQFKELLFKEFKIERLNFRLQEWHRLEWPEFFKEILKTGEKLNYKKRIYWQQNFAFYKDKALTLEKQIHSFQYKLIRSSREENVRV
ncbi:MAG: hypothetical protein ACK4ND_19880 [Cytophagaceae bacterium]